MDYAALYDGVACGRAAISLRFDDGPATDDAVYQLLKARGLVGGFALIANNVGQGGYLSAAQALDMQAHGMEILCHSRKHDAGPTNFAGFADETIGAAETLRGLGLHVNSFVQPGSWTGPQYQTGYTGPYYFDQPSKYDTAEGRLLREYFAASEAYTELWGYGNGRAFPVADRHGATHVTADSYDLAWLTARLDDLIRYGMGTTILLHTANLGQPGRISLADYTAFLDDLAARRDAGRIDVLTPTAQLHARPETPRNLLADPSFEASTTEGLICWERATGLPTIEAGGRSGQCARVDYTNTMAQYLIARNLRSLRVEAWGKSAATGTPGTARLIVQDAEDITRLNVSYTWAVGDAWARGQCNVGMHRQTRALKFWLAHTGAGPDVLYDDCAVYRT